MKVVKQVAILLISLMSWVGLFTSPPALAFNADGAQIFQVHCAGCHIHGGNIMRRNKTLKLKALQKNHVDSLDGIAAITTNGKGNMSAYQDRLSSDEIQAVAAYVWQQAETGWKAN